MYLPQIHHIQNVFDLFKGTDSSSASRFVSNDHLKQMDDDVLFHIGIRVGDLDIKKVFGDVKVKVFFSLRRTIVSLNEQSLCHKSLIKDFVFQCFILIELTTTSIASDVHFSVNGPPALGYPNNLSILRSLLYNSCPNLLL